MDAAMQAAGSTKIFSRLPAAAAALTRRTQYTIGIKYKRLVIYVIFLQGYTLGTL